MLALVLLLAPYQLLTSWSTSLPSVAAVVGVKVREYESYDRRKELAREKLVADGEFDDALNRDDPKAAVIKLIMKRDNVSVAERVATSASASIQQAPAKPATGRWVYGQACPTSRMPKYIRMPNATIQRRRCLEFMHIPKNAGTSIEAVGYRTGNGWGSMGCMTRTVSCRRKFRAHCDMPDGVACPKWHVPPKLSKRIADYYSVCEVFCVVRDPVDRFRSQYAYASANRFSKPVCDVVTMRAFAQESLDRTRGSLYKQECHLLPQVQYTGFPSGGVASYCQHVLRFEELNSSLGALLARFGISASFDGHHENAGACAIDVPADVRELVYEYYDEDYTAFGYCKH